MNERLPPFPGIISQFEPQYSTLAASRRITRNKRLPSNAQLDVIQESSITEDAPPFLRLLDIYLRHTQDVEAYNKPKHFITNVAALHEFVFSPKCPILGTGSLFVVRAKHFDPGDNGFRPIDGRSINTELYCLKTPNFNSNSIIDGEDFRKEYYDTALQELRILLHPKLRTCENIINLFGLDFQEDYDDYKVAWPVLLTEYAEYGTLNNLQENISFNAELERLLLLDVAFGLQALHQCNIIHGDVKSENVLVCRHPQRKYVARISSFGLSVINPNSDLLDHKLPGGTFLWSAPEIEQPLSVAGMKQADVFSFGLLAWRVVVKHPYPFSLILPRRLELEDHSDMVKTVTRAKSNMAFPQLVKETLLANSHCRDFYSSMFKNEKEEKASIIAEKEHIYWVMGEIPSILDQLHKAYPENLSNLLAKPSTLLSLSAGLESLLNSKLEIARYAGFLLFQLWSSPRFQVVKRDSDECCQLLLRLCNLDFGLAQAFTACYHECCGKDAGLVDPWWTEFAASRGSYYALQSLRSSHRLIYQRLMTTPLDFEPVLENPEQSVVHLLQCCREGNYKGAIDALAAGAPARPLQEGSISALHWLVSFDDSQQAAELSSQLVKNGAALEAWEGAGDDFTYGRVTGTPLHWAIWHRNISAVQALTLLISQPDRQNVDRAICIAASMHFHDVLELLRNWIVRLKSSARSDYDWHSAMICAADNSTYALPRKLRHQPGNLASAFEKTMNIIISVEMPSAEDVEIMFDLAVSQNNPPLLRLLFTQLGLAKRKDLFKPRPRFPSHPIFTLIVQGSLELLNIFIEQGILSSQMEFGPERFRPLQVCCVTRQRDLAFVTKLLEIGCPVDDIGGTDASRWTPFSMAVSLGMSEIATLLLEHGADKDYMMGWLGGSTVTMNLLQIWPEIPLSRLKYLLEELPRLGFGHISFWSWSEAGGNLIYGLAMSHWPSLTSGSPLGRSAKYIFNQLGDRDCLNNLDKLGQTALQMACATGNLEIIGALIDAGQDVNLSVAATPLKEAKDWLENCRRREQEAISRRGEPGGEFRLAQLLSNRASVIVELLERNGAIERTPLEAMEKTRHLIASGKWQKPTEDKSLDRLSGFLSRTSIGDGGSTSSKESKDHRGRKSISQKLLGRLGKSADRSHQSGLQALDAQPAEQYWGPDSIGSSRTDLVDFPSPMSSPFQPASRSVSSVSSLRSSVIGRKSSENLPHSRHSSVASSQPPRVSPSRRPISLFGRSSSQVNKSSASIETQPRPQSVLVKSQQQTSPAAQLQPQHTAPSRMAQSQTPLRGSTPVPIQPQHTAPSQLDNWSKSTCLNASPATKSLPSTSSDAAVLYTVTTNSTAIIISTYTSTTNLIPTSSSNLPTTLPSTPPTATIPLPIRPLTPTNPFQPQPTPQTQQPPVDLTKPPQSQPLVTLLNEIRNQLLLYILEGPGASHTLFQRISHAKTVLEELLAVPVKLSGPVADIGQCEDFYEVKRTVRSCLEAMGLAMEGVNGGAGV
ncbi:hypothetical protein B0J14DRAFT_557600 [Halenospora varia]|nr:hypothetical protein B0J14DRAFT_557600 [Halenospora varia]